MDKYFNHDVANWIQKSMLNMDEDEALMFAEHFVYEVHKQDIENNRRTLTAHTERIQKSLLGDLSPQLRAAVEEIYKGKTPYEEEYGKPQPRGAGGRWSKISINVERGKAPKQRTSTNFREDTIRANAGGRDFDLTGALRNAQDEGNAFAQRWTERGERDQSTNERTYRRIAAGAQLLSNMPSNKVKAAAAVAQFAGEFGPEAEKVIGPAARRTAYRYRGTERQPDKQLVDYSDVALEAELASMGGSTKDVTPEIRMAGSEKAATAYLMQRLPSKRLSELQRQSGKIPPSEGVIINSEGDVVTQAVGYNEDHYLPFNLKNLKGLKGGSYVRTRSSGGLTSEDIYTGLISGARSVTVVSRSGVFTIDFEDDLRGGRRYSDKARQMIGRYSSTLDAVQSEKVARRQLSPDERAEVRDEVESEVEGLGYGTGEIEQMIKEREREYVTNPRLTRAELDKINRQAVEAASEWTPIRSGSSVGNKDRVRDLPEKVPTDPKKRISYFKSELMDAAMEEKSKRMYQLDADGYHSAMEALQEQFPYFIARVDYRPLPGKNGPARSTEKDSGYVRPGYNRPRAVQAGYFDPEINGSGKFSASRLNNQNYGASRVRESADGGEAAAEAGTTKTRVKDSDLNAQRAKVQAQSLRAAAVKSAADDVVDLLGDEEKKSYPVLARYAQDRNIDTVSQGDLDKLMTELSGLQVRLSQQSEESYKAQGEALKTKLQNARNYDDVLKETHAFNKEDANPRVVPNTPHKFADSPEHSFGQSQDVYDSALSKAIARGGLQDEMSASSSDDVLRTLEKKYGELYAAASELTKSPEDPNLLIGLSNAMLGAGMGNDQVRGLVGQVQSGGASHVKSLADSTERKWLAVKEVRSIKHHAKSATPSASKTESVADSTLKGEVVESKGDLPSRIRSAAGSVPSEYKRRVEELANALQSGSNEDVQDALDELPGSIRSMFEDEVNGELTKRD